MFDKINISELNKVFVDNSIFKKDFSKIYDFYLGVKEVLEKNKLQFQDLQEVIPELIIHNQETEVLEGENVSKTQEKWLNQLIQIKNYLQTPTFLDYQNQILLFTNKYISQDIVGHIIPMFADDYLAHIQNRHCDLLHFVLEKYEISEASLDKILNKLIPTGFNLNVFEYQNGQLSKTYLQKAILQKHLMLRLVESGVPVVLPEHQHNNLCHLLDVPVLDETRISLVEQMIAKSPDSINAFDKKHIKLLFVLLMKGNNNTVDRIKKFIIKNKPSYTEKDLYTFLHKVIQNDSLTEKYVENIQKINIFYLEEYRDFYSNVRNQLVSKVEKEDEGNNLQLVVAATETIL